MLKNVSIIIAGLLNNALKMIKEKKKHNINELYEQTFK